MRGGQVRGGQVCAAGVLTESNAKPLPSDHTSFGLSAGMSTQKSRTSSPGDARNRTCTCRTPPRPGHEIRPAQRSVSRTSNRKATQRNAQKRTSARVVWWVGVAAPSPGCSRWWHRRLSALFWQSIVQSTATAICFASRETGELPLCFLLPGYHWRQRALRLPRHLHWHDQLNL